MGLLYVLSKVNNSKKVNALTWYFKLTSNHIKSSFCDMIQYKIRRKYNALIKHFLCISYQLESLNYTVYVVLTIHMSSRCLI